jgi:hypothetical protein
MWGAGLACALAVAGATATSAAAAPPEFLHLGGPLTVTKFTGKSTGAVKITDPALGVEVKCGKEELEGLIEPGSTTHVEEVLIKFKPCTAVILAGGKVNKCSIRSLGSAAGTIRTKRLDGDLVAVAAAEAPSEVGLDLKAEVGTIITVLSAPGCGVPNMPIEGSVIGEVMPIGPPEGTERKLISAAVGGKQKIQILPSGAKDTLSIGASEAVLVSSVTLKFAELMEVT